MPTETAREDELLLKAVRRLEGKVLGLVFGLVCGTGLFVATLWLVIRGGRKVGQHLSLLGEYFIGYSVSIPGSFVGFIYGFLCGFAAGWLMAWLYNRIASVRAE